MSHKPCTNCRCHTCVLNDRKFNGTHRCLCKNHTCTDCKDGNLVYECRYYVPSAYKLCCQAQERIPVETVAMGLENHNYADNITATKQLMELLTTICTGILNL